MNDKNRTKKLVTTGFRENYAVHDWDANGRKGECPYYWKEKFGSTYLFHNATHDEIEQILVYDNEYIDQYLEVVSCVVDEAEIEKAWEVWQPKYHWTKLENGEWLREEFSAEENCSYPRGLKSHYYSWKYKSIEDARTDKSEFTCRYDFDNGMVAHSEEEATKIFKEVDFK